MTLIAQNIIGTNVASIVLKRKNDPPPGSHVFQPTGIIFEFFQDIIVMNLLAKFHEDLTINVASKEKNAPPLGSHVFQAKPLHFQDMAPDTKVLAERQTDNAKTISLCLWREIIKSLQ
ncbi:hypothetical protein DPMN_029121 [Dreissena polymorpha]|uniref:Uncharacterized protein n=1 Tax=Dreissena polymorpha TaxID=45954 RepID=A0A9D4RF65_DREPO|nr:hypothetical protein DPMN_029121 [Dreissena polymorpha]